MILTLLGHIKCVCSANFSPNDESIISCSWDYSIKIWEVKTGNLLKTLLGHKNTVSEVLYTPDSIKIISSAHDNTIKIWNS
jgi:WD40 repeat protein